MTTDSRLAGLSPAKQALLLRQLRERAGAAGVARRTGRGPAPLSLAQELLWLAGERTPASTAYNFPDAYWVRGTLDHAALASAIAALVDRQAALRTVIETRDGAPIQVITAAVPISIVDLTVKPVAEREAAALALARAEAERPFDLARGPLFRATLVRTAPDVHLLVLVVHHIVFDGWSRGVLLRELSELYEALVAGRAATLPTLACEFADFAAWQRQQLAGPVLERHLAHWAPVLAGLPEALDLPTDRPRAPGSDARAGLRALLLSAGDRDRWLRAAEAGDATLFMLLLAGFQALLHRYSGQDDVVIASPTAGRARPEVESLIGYFVSVLPMRACLGDDPTFADLLARTRHGVLGALDHQLLPVERLAHELRERGEAIPAGGPTVSFAMQNHAGGALRLGAAVLEPVPLGSREAKFDLSLLGSEPDGKLRLALEFRTDLFDDGTVDRLLGHLVRLVDAAVAQPSLRLSELPLLDADERHLLLHSWNDTARPYDLETTLPALVAAQAARTPLAIAVVDEAEQLTYAELDRRANQLAHLLLRRGVRPGDLVAVCLERSVRMSVALLGVQKAAAAYVPLDPEYPRDRLAFMVADARARLVITEERLLPLLGTDALCLDRDAAALAAESDGPCAAAPGPDTVAYMIYTSGSTGRPKGALNTHRGIVNRLLWMQERYDIGPGDVVLQKTPFSFDVSVWELFWPLLAGARLVFARPGGQRDPGYLADLIRRGRVTVCHFVPSMLRAFLEGAAAGQVAGCTSLRHVMCSGEALPRDLVDQFFARVPNASLHNLYGPTECAVDVTHWTCVPGDLRGVVPIGRPVANTRVYVLDARGEPSPIGVPGELYLAGVQVGCGYHNRPDLTAERFVPDPFAPAPSARMYRTGDRARWRPDGVIEFLGRLDDQVKLRGFRIELGEIEASLREHPEVRDATVVVREDVPGDPRLVAYVVGDRVDAPALRQTLGMRLPAYMVPTSIVVLEALPLGPSGKLNRRALPAPAPEAASVAEEPPRTATEAVVGRAFAEVLRRTSVGIHDNFFALGGHSLLAVQLAARLGKLFRTDVPVRLLFEHPAVAAVAAALASRESQAGRTERIAQLLQQVEAMTAAQARERLDDSAAPATNDQGAGQHGA